MQDEVNVLLSTQFAGVFGYYLYSTDSSQITASTRFFFLYAINTFFLWASL